MVKVGGVGAVRAGVAAAALLSVAAAAPAALGADPGTFTQSTAPAAGGQSLIIRVGVSGTAPETLYASIIYYPGAAGVCAPTPQQQAGTHILDQVPVTGPFALRRDSAPVPAGLYTVCGYLFRGVPPDNLYFVQGNGDIIGTDPTGSGSSGGKTPTAVAMLAARQGSRYVFAGTTNGAGSGSVRVQRRAGATWRTIATAAVRKRRWRVVAAARKGQTVRALFTAKGARPSTSHAQRLR